MPNTSAAAFLITPLQCSHQFIADSIMSTSNNTNINTTVVNQATSNDYHRDAVAMPIVSSPLLATQTATNTTTNQQPCQSYHIQDHTSNSNNSISTTVVKNQATSNEKR